APPETTVDGVPVQRPALQTAPPTTEALTMPAEPAEPAGAAASSAAPAGPPEPEAAVSFEPSESPLGSGASLRIRIIDAETGHPEVGLAIVLECLTCGDAAMHAVTR